MTPRPVPSSAVRAGLLTWLLGIGFLGVSIVAVAPPAAAHSGIEPSAVDAGVPTTFTVTIPHGCAPGEPPPGAGETISPTTEVSLRLPPDAVVDAASAPAGWEVATSVEDGRAIIDWSGGDVAPQDAGEFSFSARLYGDAGDALPVEVFQGCVEGSYRWIEVPPELQDASEPSATGDEPLDQPAPLIELLTSASAPIPTPTATPAATPVPRPTASVTAPPASPTATAEPTATPVPAPSVTGSRADDEPGDGAGSSAAVVAAILVIMIGALAVGANRRGGGP